MNRKHVNAFTLIEVIVIIGIAGLLIALLLPALQAARESSRRTRCAANLKQIGYALQIYHSSMGSLPMMNNGLRAFSALSMILPYLESNDVYNNINFMISYREAQNITSRSQSISIFLCPSDFAPDKPHAWTNYACNTGYSYQQIKKYNGVFVKNPDQPVAFGGITDGTTTTVMVSEWVHGSGIRGVGDSLSIAYVTSQSGGPAEFKKFISDCSNVQIEAIKKGNVHKGSEWISSSFGHAAYNHNMKINDHSCLNGGSIADGAWTAGSRHGLGCNVLFADGHVSFINNNINIELWRSVSTRAGGEIVNVTDF